MTTAGGQVALGVGGPMVLGRARAAADAVSRSEDCLDARQRLGLVLVINVVMVLALVGVGLAANSLGVVASGADYLGDALGTGLSLVALRVSRDPHGYPRATSFAALVNATLLLLVTMAVSVEAVYRLSTGAPSIDGLPVILVSVVAAAAMIACALILGDVQGDLNMQSVMLDTVADAAAALGVAVSGAVILITGRLFWMDSVVALIIALVVGYHAVRLIRSVLADLHEKHVRHRSLNARGSSRPRALCTGNQNRHPEAGA